MSPNHIGIDRIGTEMSIPRVRARHVIAAIVAASSITGCIGPLGSSEPDADPSELVALRTDVRTRISSTLVDLRSIGLNPHSASGRHRQCTGDDPDFPSRRRTWSYEASAFADVPLVAYDSDDVDEALSLVQVVVEANGWRNVNDRPMTHLGAGGFQAYDGEYTITIRSITSDAIDLPDLVALRVSVEVASPCLPVSDELHDDVSNRDREPIEVGSRPDLGGLGVAPNL